MKNAQIPILIIEDHETTRALQQLFEHDHQLTCTDDTDQALEYIAKTDYAVIMCGMRMPNMDGVSLLIRAKQLKPDSVRLLLSDHDDMDSTIKAINDGHIFSYISKPWDNTYLCLNLKNAVEHFNLTQALAAANAQLITQNDSLRELNLNLERRVSKRTQALEQANKRLSGSAHKQRQLFQSLLDMVDLIINDRIRNEAGHNKRIAYQSRLMADSLGLDKSQSTHIYLAGLLADIGKVAISDELLQQPEYQLDPSQHLEFQQHVIKAAEILQPITHLNEAAKIIKHQNEHYSGGGFPGRLKKRQIPLGSRILLILKDYDHLLLGLKYTRKHTPLQARAYLKKHAGHLYDPKLIRLFFTLLNKHHIKQQNHFDHALTSNRLQIGNVLEQDVLYENGSLFLPKDTLITEALLHKIKQYENSHEQNFIFYIDWSS